MKRSAIATVILSGVKETVLILFLLWVGCGAPTRSGQSLPRAPIHDAAQSNNTATLDELLNANPELINLPGPCGRTPLHFAASSGSLEATKMLLQKGANINARDQYGCTPLLLTVYGFQTEIVKLLAASGANVNLGDNGGRTPLHQAACASPTEIVVILLKNGANPNAQDRNGVTPLHEAARTADEEVLELLLKNNADVAIRHRTYWGPAKPLEMPLRQPGGTALHDAVQWGRCDLVRILVTHKADVNAKDDDGRTPLQVAIDKADSKMIDLLKRSGAQPK
jgi:ankyrin repeat protein